MRNTKNRRAKEPSQLPRIESLWTIEEVAEFLRIPVATLYRWRTMGTGPTAFRVGRHLRYNPDAVRSWLLEGAA
ncbi:helix-turn-helix domain-containing protein [Promicromonospora sp. NPDC060204]|uniref:helix-turn-helix domain-containing protein n=1 Tax=Promicromonospora sp. NPDC060204 TaxID=3347071 RepID=UPI003651C6CB